MTIGSVPPVTKNKMNLLLGMMVNTLLTKVLSRKQVEKAFGDKWEQFKKARENADLQNRF